MLISTLPRMAREHWFWVFWGDEESKCHHDTAQILLLIHWVKGFRKTVFSLKRILTQKNDSNGHMDWGICHLNDALINCSRSLSQCWTHMNTFIPGPPFPSLGEPHMFPSQRCFSSINDDNFNQVDFFINIFFWISVIFNLFADCSCIKRPQNEQET